MKKRFTKYIWIALGIMFAIPQAVFAQPDFTPVEGSGNQLFLPNLFGGATGPAGERTFGDLVLTIINIALLVVGSVAVLFFLYGGFRYITARGNEEAAEDAKRIILNSVIGLVVVILAFAIVTIIANLLVTGRA